MISEDMDAATAALRRLLVTMQALRSTNGCDWDRQQTPDSLKKYIIEEAYEVIEAIDHGDPREICEELGDLLLQVVFQAQIFQERNLFGMADIADAIDKKLKRRHPHIFAESSAESREIDWERIKQEERTAKGQPHTLASRIPQAFPALKRAEKLAAQTGATSTPDPVRQSLLQLLSPLGEDETEISESLIGDTLFRLTALARCHDIDAEEALRLTVDRRIKEIDQGAGSCPDCL